MRVTPALLLLVTTAAPAAAQSEEHIRTFFEGKRVVVRLEMPGSEEGVDVYPGTSQPIDFPRHATRLKRFGTAIRPGDEVMVTKVKVKKDLVEFQLGGGGYGTFGDDDGGDVSVPLAEKTQREENLEKEIERTSDSARRRRLREELDELRKERQREDARNQAAAAQARQAKEEYIRERRAEGGSRFNLRYRPAVPLEVLTPEGVMVALAEYVDFSPALGERPASEPVAEPSPVELRKGLTVEEVDALLGRPETISRRQEGSLTVSTSLYRSRDRRITAEFVEGVLIRFTIASP